MSSRNEQDSLLLSVLTDPHSDEARLVYADWLEEYGGELEQKRAEVIRYQVANPWPISMAPAHMFPSQTRKWRRTMCLIEDHWRHWVGNIGGNFTYSTYGARWGNCPVYWSWRRGWPDDLMLPAASWGDLSEKITAAWPVTRVTLSGTLPTVEVAIEDQFVSIYHFRLGERDFSTSLPHAGFRRQGRRERWAVIKRVLEQTWPHITFSASEVGT